MTLHVGVLPSGGSGLFSKLVTTFWTALDLSRGRDTLPFSSSPLVSSCLDLGESAKRKREGERWRRRKRKEGGR